ncbi:sporulation protein YpjB [Salipaludibacillus daqingensis]|uniref:sporulation protein YpjB n=1 Tax=Salipaludibacillus daqingensis TaxID=3041001 RepID=UPI0024742B08|nr:sporulation protein YpjB [Salipaludibacillus daqingensis]
MRKGRFTSILTMMLLLIVFTGASNAYGEEEKHWSELNQKSDTILQYVKQHHYDEAAEMLDHFGELFLKIDRTKYELTMNELQVITSTYDEAVHAVKSASLSHRERIFHAYQLRLLMDIYVNEDDPLWLKLKEPMLSSLNELLTSKQGTTELSVKKVNHFLSYYETAKPTWKVSLSPQRLQRIDSQIEYLKKMMDEGDVSQQEWDQHMERIEKELLVIFAGEGTEKESDPSLYWLIITISGAIFSSLSYVGWKKYRAQQAERLKRKRRQNQ